MIQERTKLSADQMTLMRRQLKEELDRIQMELENLQQRSSMSSHVNQPSEEGQPTADAARQREMASGARERILVRRSRTWAALDRLESGTYGKCCQCEVLLPFESLNADPAAPFCADCQGEIDERRKSR